MKPQDIFISYAWRDNLPPVGIGVRPEVDRWVWMFQEALEVALGIKLGRDARVWIDKREIKTNERIEAVLSAELKRSRVLVAMMSPSWLNSEWCPRELQEFLDSHPGTQTAESVFVVEIEPVERALWERKIAVKGLPFYKKVPGGFGYLRFGHPLPSLTDREYHDQIASLASELRDFLLSAPVDRAPDASPAANPESTAEPPRERPELWIGDPTPNLLKERRELTEAVRQAGFEVVTPNIEQLVTLEREQQLTHLQEGLARASLFVQLVGTEVGEPSPDGRSWARLQADEAMAAAQRQATPYLRWRRPATAVDAVSDLRHRELLTGAVEMGIEELRSDVIKRLHALASSTTEATDPARPSPSSVCVSYSEDDVAVAESLGDMLRQLEVDFVGFPSPSRSGDAADADRLSREEDRAIAESNGVIIIYGRAAREWLTTKIMRANKLRGRNRGLWGALIDAPAPNKVLPPMVPSIQRHDWRERPRFDLLKQFIDSLPGSAHA